MKPEIPTCSPVTWREIYAVAEKFNALRPWELLDGLDLIGVRNLGSGETGYGVVMGSEGTLFGYCLYLGAEGFDVYRRLTDMELDIEDDDVFALQYCLKLELGSRNYLEPQDLAVIKSLGLKFKGKNDWPQFRSLRPSYFPWYLDEKEARFLNIGLEAVCHHTEELVKGTVEVSMREKEILVYNVMPGSPAKLTSGWEPRPVVERKPIPTLPIDLKRISALGSRKLKPDSPWEAGIFFLPSPLLDSKRPYFMRVAAVCQQSTGHAFGGEVLPPEAGDAQSLAEAILSSVEKSGFLPEVIYVGDEDVAVALEPLINSIRSSIRYLEKLDVILFMKEEMSRELLRKGKY